MFNNLFAQQTDTLIIKIPRDNHFRYAIYINDTLYDCRNSYKDELCMKQNSYLFDDEDYYVLQTGNITLYYINRGHFKPTDSIYANGKVNFSTNEKPYYDDIIADERGCHEPEQGDCIKVNPSITNGWIDRKGKTNAKGQVFRGRREGKWVYDSYNLANVEEYYVKGLRDGEYRVYTQEKEDSTLYQTTFKNGTGVEKMYRNRYGTREHSLYRITYFKDGVQDLGYPLEEFHPNGTLARSTDYQKGVIQSYYSTGLLRSIRVVSFIDSLTNGKPTPIPKIASYFDRRGELISIYTFDKEGKVLDSEMYKNIKHVQGKVWYLESGNFRYLFKGREGVFYQIDEDGNEVEVEF